MPYMHFHTVFDPFASRLSKVQAVVDTNILIPSSQRKKKIQYGGYCTAQAHVAFSDLTICLKELADFYQDSLEDKLLESIPQIHKHGKRILLRRTGVQYCVLYVLGVL